MSKGRLNRFTRLFKRKVERRDELTEAEREEYFRLKYLRRSVGCPSCNRSINALQAMRGKGDDTKPDEQEYVCPYCRVELKFSRPMFGDGYYFTLLNRPTGIRYR